MCDWNHGLPPAFDPLERLGEQRTHEAVELVLGAVVGVQRDVHRVVLRHLLGERREGQRTAHHVLDRMAREVVGATGRDLDDAVGAGVGEALDGRVERLRRLTLMAGYAKEPAFARSSMSAYTSGVAMGIASPASGCERVLGPPRILPRMPRGRAGVPTVRGRGVAPSTANPPPPASGAGLCVGRRQRAGSKTYGVVVATRCSPRRRRIGSESGEASTRTKSLPRSRPRRARCRSVAR